MKKFIAILLLVGGFATWAKFQQGPAPAVASTQLANSSDLQNCSVAAASSSNTLVISLKDGAGSDPSSSSACKIAFRNATAATGTFATVSVTAATSVTISNGSSLGCTASTQCVLYVYAINNAGTVVLGAKNGFTVDEGSVQSSTAEGGAGAADALDTIYSTAAQSSKAVRLLARLTVTPGGSHAWDAAPTEISNAPFKQTGWYINAAFTGANPSLGTSAVSSYTEIIDAGLTLTPKSGSAPAGTMCSTTNAATAASTSATTCAAGSESLGIAFALPWPGNFRVCASISTSATVDAADAYSTIIQLIETPTSAQTLTLESGPKLDFNMFGPTGATDHVVGLAGQLCGTFNWKHKAAGTVVGVRLMYEQAIAGTPDSHIAVCDANTDNGQRDCTFEVYPLF